jgi:SAM-dependent methyltransferase
MLLFPEGRTELADAVYRDTATARFLNETIAGAVCRLGASGAIRVLEVGAGTCATSEVVLARAASAGIRLHYTATDVSQFFLSTGRSRLPGARFAVLDLNRSPIVQGFPPSSADVVVAAGALNAARDVDAAVRGLARLLTPGGWLLVSEPTREHVEILASQAFMMAPPLDVRARTATSFLDCAQWAAVFAGAGLVPRATLPADDHALAPLGQRLFLVQAPDTTESTTRH